MPYTQLHTDEGIHSLDAKGRGFAYQLITEFIHPLQPALRPAGQNSSDRAVVGPAMVDLERSGTSRRKE